MKISVDNTASAAQSWINAISAAQPKIGTMKFAAVDDLSSCDIQTNMQESSFIGWVPANGQTYYLSDFLLSSELMLMYGEDNGTFSVPCLSSFC